MGIVDEKLAQVHTFDVPVDGAACLELLKIVV